MNMIVRKFEVNQIPYIHFKLADYPYGNLFITGNLGINQSVCAQFFNMPDISLQNTTIMGNFHMLRPYSQCLALIFCRHFTLKDVHLGRSDKSGSGFEFKGNDRTVLGCDPAG